MTKPSVLPFLLRQDETRLHFGLFSLHAADVGDIASDWVFAAEAPRCAWPAAIDYWRVLGRDSTLAALESGQN